MASIIRGEREGMLILSDFRELLTELLWSELTLFKNEVFLHLGSVCPSETVRSFFVNFGMLELTYRLQTFRDYSYSS